MGYQHDYIIDVSTATRPLQVPCRAHYDLAIADIGTTTVAHPAASIDRNGGDDGWVITVYPSTDDLCAETNDGGTRDVSDAGVVTTP
jgi:hypothetical protein